MRAILPRRLPTDLRSRLNLLVLVALVPMIVVQMVIFGHWYGVRKQSEFLANVEVARVFGSSFDRYVDDLTETEETLGEALLLTPPGQRNDLLTRHLRRYTAISSFSWVESTGRITYSSRPEVRGVSVADRQYFKDLKKGADWSLSDVLYTKVSNDRRVVLAAAVREPDRALLGAILGELTPEEIEMVLPPGWEGEGVVTLFDRQSVLVAVVPPSEARRRPEMLTERDHLSGECRQTGKEIAGTFKLPGDPNLRLAARVPLKRIGWVAGASRPLAEVTGPVKRNMLFMLLPVLVVSIGALVLAQRMAKSLARSVLNLREGATALAAGKQSQVEVPRIDELKDLALTFNRMADQLTRHTASLEFTASELSRSNKELEAFTYTVSHDLRAPLRAIDGFANALQEDYSNKLDSEGRRFLGIISQNTQRMGQLIDDLLAYSRLGRKELSSQPVDMEEMVQQVADELALMRQADPTALEVSAMPMAEADPTLVRQVLANLLSNAFKFASRREQPRIQVGGRQEAGENVYWVKDNGVGFDMRYKNKLFGIFQRLHSMEEFPGTGVGLAIVHRVIQKHGGRVWAEGKVDEGAAFFFTLPRKERTA